MARTVSKIVKIITEWISRKRKVCILKIGPVEAAECLPINDTIAGQ